ncbi:MULTISPECIES: hypothetical protein [Bacillus]|uniref:hypothetical protein n=1 Tax=Bacillus TaxID=1386 RepID=UPI00027A0B18|nr:MULTISPECIES: hypothetical protein [Bacillus]EJR57191.1 hypothetical protein IIM_00300 [Bacillus cereus VD107]KMN46993.1 hypothetical protein VK90_01350 [Bacillus sp. LK2]MED0959046.1 hypothetical protein [Bacillus paramycoides]MED0978063.1 hypothetical protein [Bacillus paramycoides]MED0986578.1 hypothetical protein [Bacillus paramycoides]
MLARLNGRLMNQLGIFFSLVVLFQFVADITGLMQHLDTLYFAINNAISYITFGLAVIFTVLGAKEELSKYAIILLCLVVGVRAIYYAAIVILWSLAGTP